MNFKYLLFLSICVILAFITFSYTIVFVFDKKTMVSLTHEDGFFESCGAICFFIASILFFFAFWKEPQENDLIFLRTRKNLFYLFLSIMFLFAFGEEISWGQRIFNWKTPERLLNINIQQETNVHNLYLFHGLDPNKKKKTFLSLLLNFDRLFSLFWFIYCVVTPVLNHYVFTIYRCLKRIQLPIIPIWLSIVFVGNYLSAKYLICLKCNSMINENLIITEIKECNFSLLFMLVSICFIINRLPLKTASGTILKQNAVFIHYKDENLSTSYASEKQFQS